MHLILPPHTILLFTIILNTYGLDPVQDCIAEYSLCYNTVGKVHRSGPPLFVSFLYRPPPPVIADIVLPPPCDGKPITSVAHVSTQQVRALCDVVKSVSVPIHKELSSVNNILVDLQKRLDRIVPRRRARRSLWDIFRFIIPDTRMDAIQSSIQALQSRTELNSEAIMKLQKQLVVVSDQMTSRVTTLAEEFHNTTQRTLEMFKETASSLETLTTNLKQVEMKIDYMTMFLTNMQAYFNQCLLLVIQLRTQVSDFSHAIDLLILPHLSPSLIPPETLESLLQGLTTTLYNTDFELAIPVSSLDLYYSLEVPYAKQWTHDGAALVFTLAVPTRFKKHNQELIMIYPMRYSFPVLTYDQPAAEKSAIDFTIDHEPIYVAVETPSEGSGVQSIYHVAILKQKPKLNALGSYEVTDSAWVQPTIGLITGCLPILLVGSIGRIPQETLAKIITDQCVPRVRAASTVTFYRVATRMWFLKLGRTRNNSWNIQMRTYLSSNGDFIRGGSPIPLKQVADCVRWGCFLTVPCGSELIITTMTGVLTTSVETMLCSRDQITQPKIENATVTSRYEPLAQLVIPNFTPFVNASTQTQRAQYSLSKLNELIEQSTKANEIFREKDRQFEISLKKTTEEVKSLGVSFLEAKRIVDKQISEAFTQLDKLSWGQKLYRGLSAAFLVVSVVLTIVAVRRMCNNHPAARGMATLMPLMGKASGFSTETSLPTSFVIPRPSFFETPEGWGLIIGIAVLVSVLVLLYLWNRRVSARLRDIGYIGPQDLVLTHMGSLIETQLPTLIGRQLQPVASLPKLNNWEFRLPAQGGPHCAVMIWLSYNMPRVGIMNFMTPVGHIRCVDRYKIQNAHISQSEYTMDSPDNSSFVCGVIRGITIETIDGVLLQEQARIKLSIPPSICHFVFHVRGLALVCQQCGNMWLAHKDLPTEAIRSHLSSPISAMHG